MFNFYPRIDDVIVTYDVAVADVERWLLVALNELPFDFSRETTNECPDFPHWTSETELQYVASDDQLEWLLPALVVNSTILCVGAFAILRISSNLVHQVTVIGNHCPFCAQPKERQDQVAAKRKAPGDIH